MSVRLPFSNALFAFAQPTTMCYATAMARIAHFVLAMLPGMLIVGLLPAAHDTVNFPQALALSVSAGLLCVLMLSMFGVYGNILFSNQSLFQRSFFAWTISFGLLLAVNEPFRFILRVPRDHLLAWYLLSLCLLVVSRLVMLAFFQQRIRRGKFVHRSVILGMTQNALHLADYILENAGAGSGLLGFIDDRDSSRLPRHRLPHLGGSATLEQMVREGKVDQVLMALPATAHERNNHYVQQLRRLPVQVLLVPDMSTFQIAHRRMVPVAGSPMFVVAEPPLQGWAPLIKRSEDIVLSSVALLLLAPLMLLIAVAVKLESRGPVLFRQKRYGYNNRLIEVYKFRSMYHHLRDEHAGVQTGKNDPRVTRVGRFIRKTSLDELPQLLNVLAGTMSMVGPRPHASATKAANVLFEDAVEEYVSRHRVKPGITGLAQVNGYRGETDTIEKIQLRVEYDLEYIETWSLWLDLSILLRTLPAVLSARAAY